MAYKSITTVVTNAVRDNAALEAAAELARRNSGHLDVLCLGLDHTLPGFYYSGTNAIAMQSNLALAEAVAIELNTLVYSMLEGRELNWSTRPLYTQSAGLSQFLAYHTRFSDVVVLIKPYGEGKGHENETIAESALFDAQVPILIIPDTAVLPAKFKRVVVAWNESPEALTAIRAAMPVLKEADVVNIAIIDPPEHAPDRSDPGGALSQMLARHGVQSEVSVLAKTMPRISDVIERHVSDQNADLLVMGAYGHSRFREAILGGATRNMLERAPVPVFMAH